MTVKLAFLFGWVFALFFAGGAWAYDPENVVGAERCGECHKSEHATWKDTRHYKTFYEMHKRDKAREIADKLGIKRMKTERLCMTCHYSRQSDGGKVKAVSGVSCESCHGPARAWVDVHQDYGKGLTKETESESHRESRWESCASAGMIRPSNIYNVAANCYGCHTVPFEDLVNKGGHPAGSRFELLSWSQGEVRHNYIEGAVNRPATQARKRILYMVGRMLDLEFGLRGVVKATSGKLYAKAMARRVKKAAVDVEALYAVAAVDEIKEILDALPRKADGKLRISLKAKDQLLVAAEKISAAAQRFATNHDGGAFAAVDALLPGEGDFKGMAKP